MGNSVWSDGEIAAAIEALRRSVSVDEAMAKMPRPIATRTLRDEFHKRGLQSPKAYLGVVLPDPVKPVAPVESALPRRAERHQQLVDLLRKGPVPFSELCDKLDMSPKRARELVESAIAKGAQVRLENDHVGIDKPTHDHRIQDIPGITPRVGEVQRVAVISDTHAGSKFVMREQLRDFVNHAYDQGIRDVLHPGDVLDGCYRHGVFELTHTGLDEQCQDAFETLPQRPGLNYHFISGNHDFTFSEKSGFSVGHHIVNYFRERGRNDIHFYGDRSAFLQVNGATVHLWHPKVGTSYARSYSIQKQIEKYSSIKPQILLIGHWHVFCYIYERGVHGVACPTFQGGQSAFGKSLGGAPAIGGLILSWKLTEHGTIRDFNITTSFYFEREEPVQLYNRLDAEPVQPTVYRSSAVRM